MRVIARSVVVCLLCISALAQPKPEADKMKKFVPEPPMLGPHMARGEASPFGRGSANMTFHNGNILGTTVVQAIFWGTSWAGYTGDEISGIDSWYKGVNGSGYARTSDEYAGIDELTGTANTAVTSSISYSGYLIDSSAAPSKAPQTSTILGEVCKMISNPVANGYYPVYIDQPRGGANYCAWHSWATCNNVPVQFAFFFKLDGDAGCDPQDKSGAHSQGLAALANVTGHELSEARTDARGTGWFDSSQSENGDKCAWTFGTPLLTFPNGTQWKIQGNWSNHAYTGRFGYANLSGQAGCLDGGNYAPVAP